MKSNRVYYVISLWLGLLIFNSGVYPAVQNPVDDSLDFSRVISDVPSGEAVVETALSSDTDETSDSDALGEEDDEVLDEDFSSEEENYDDYADTTGEELLLEEDSTVVSAATAVVPDTSSVLNSLKSDERVALISYQDVLWPMVIKISDDKKSLVTSKINPNDPSCQFILRKDTENFLHFISEAADGKAVTASKDTSFAVTLATENQSDQGQQWALTHDTELEKWFGQIVRLACRPTGTNLAVPSDDMKKQGIATVSTAIEGKPAGEERESRFKILPLKEIKDKIITGGGKSFNYNPRYHSWYNPTFSEQWKSSVPGSVSLVFDVATPGVFSVAFTSSPVRSLGGMYYIRFGVMDEGQSAEQIVISRDVIGSALSRINYSAKQATTYWITIDQGTIAIGTGKKIGQNQLGKYVDDNPLKTVQYVGLGGLATPIDFNNITIAADTATRKQELYLPPGFTLEKSVPMRVVVSGSRDEKLVAWGLGVDGNMYRWDTAGSTLGWKLHTAYASTGKKLDGLQDVSMSSDGILFCLSHGKAYEFDWRSEKWVLTPEGEGNQELRLDQIAVGNRQAIWASDAVHTTVFQYVNGGWQQQLDACIGVSVGYDGTVVAINDAGEPYVYDQSSSDPSAEAQWISLAVDPGIMPESSLPHFTKNAQQAIQLESVAVQNINLMYGVTKDLKLVRFQSDENGQNGTWQWMVGVNMVEPFDKGIARGLLELQVNAAGVLFGRTQDGAVYKKGTDGFKPHTSVVVSPGRQRMTYADYRKRGSTARPGRGVTRLGRRARAQGAIADTRVKRLNRGNLGGKSLQRVGVRQQKTRGGVRVGQPAVKARGVASARTRVGIRTVPGARIARVAQPSRVGTSRPSSTPRATINRSAVQQKPAVNARVARTSPAVRARTTRTVVGARGTAPQQRTRAAVQPRAPRARTAVVARPVRPVPQAQAAVVKYGLPPASIIQAQEPIQEQQEQVIEEDWSSQDMSGSEEEWIDLGADLGADLGETDSGTDL